MIKTLLLAVIFAVAIPLGASTSIAGCKEALQAYFSGNYAIAAIELNQGCGDQGNAEAQYLLGDLYYAGKGVSKDNNEAQKWYQRAADQGYAPAQLGLAKTYLSQNDEENYVKWLQKAANQGYAPAQFKLAVLYDLGMFVPKHIVSAYKWANLAASQTGDSSDKTYLKLRDSLEKSMTPTQILWAQRLSREWRPK
jgi:uncharacterized protein